ncbi:MAG: thiamine-phosphate kinase [Nitrospiraceae bacterium]|nr:MAG: thiamine-phosphate kinase [Nitrospiraceae bacterium]
MRQRRLGEFELIRRLRNATRIPHAVRSAVLAGIGDDAAVLKARTGRVLLATTDLLVERVHFDLACTTYRQLGYKAAMANLSDIAAMGGIPRFVMIAVAVTPRQTPRNILALYTGVEAACRLAGAVIVGGDTSASRTDLFLSLVVLGETAPAEVLRRSTARAGDHLYVTGTLGDAQAGLEILRARKKGRQRTATNARGAAYLTGRHLAPMARLREARRLAETRLASAAIDLSDGLAGDVRHICEESKVGCLIDTRQLPLSRPLITHARAGRRDPITYALGGGEDYELLFTVPPANVPRVETLIRQRLLRATPIGSITPASRGLRIIRTDGSVRPLTAKGYEHRLG